MPRPQRGRSLSQADRPHARAYLRWRHLRPPGRWFFAVFLRRALAGAALREDALRQRPAPGDAGVGLWPDREPVVPGTGRRVCWLVFLGVVFLCWGVFGFFG